MFLKSFVRTGTQSGPRRAILAAMLGENHIEALSYGGDGFRPLLVRPGWQVAQLNDRSDLRAEAIRAVERHDATDEAFVLVEGRATLVAADEAEGGALAFACVAMSPGVVYNVARGRWHAIATEPGARVIIVERDGTDVDDVRRRPLSDGERAALLKGVGSCAG